MRARIPATAVGLAAALLLAGCSGTNRPSSAPASTSPSTLPASPSPASASPSTPPPAPTHLTVRRTSLRLPIPVAREAVAPLGGGRFVVAGGLVGGDSSTNRAFVLDTRRGRVSPAPAMPVPVHDTAGIVLGRPLVVGGGNSSEQDVVQARGPRGWKVVGHLPQPRSDLTAAVVGGHGLVVGGYDGVTPAMATVLSSADGVHWRAVGSLPAPVRYAAWTVLGGHLWLFGGERSGEEQDAVQEVDARGHARVVGHLPVALGHAAAVALGGRILLVGGRTTPDTLTDRMWWFDPATGRFTAAGHLPTPLADAAVAVDGPDRAWLVGGEHPAVTDEVLRVALR